MEASREHPPRLHTCYYCVAAPCLLWDECWDSGSGPEMSTSTLSLCPALLLMSRVVPHQWQLLSRMLTCSLSLPLDVDNGYYTVKFDSLLLREAVVEGDGILPPLRTEATESDSDSDGTGDSSYARGMAAAVEPRSQEGGVTLRGSWLLRAPTV